MQAGSWTLITTIPAVFIEQVPCWQWKRKIQPAQQRATFVTVNLNEAGGM